MVGLLASPVASTPRLGVPMIELTQSEAHEVESAIRLRDRYLHYAEMSSYKDAQLQVDGFYVHIDPEMVRLAFKLAAVREQEVLDKYGIVAKRTP